MAIPFHLEAFPVFLILNVKCNCVKNLHLVSQYIWSDWKCNSGQYLTKRTSNIEHKNRLCAHESCHTDIQSGRGIVPHCLNLEPHSWVINLTLCFNPGARPSSDHLFIKTHSCSTATLHIDNRQYGETGRKPKYHCQTCWYNQCLLKYILQNALRPSSYWIWTKIISE